MDIKNQWLEKSYSWHSTAVILLMGVLDRKNRQRGWILFVCRKFCNIFGTSLMCSLAVFIHWYCLMESCIIWTMRRNWKDQFIIAEKWYHIVVHHHLPKEIPFHKNWDFQWGFCCDCLVRGDMAWVLFNFLMNQNLPPSYMTLEQQKNSDIFPQKIKISIVLFLKV